ncbi:MAG: serine acetyltransferase [Lachnospirales bacterium]
MGRIDKLKNIFSISYYKKNTRAYKDLINYDYKFNAAFRGVKSLSRKEKNSIEIKYLKCYRKCQAYRNTLWGDIAFIKLKKLSEKTGIGLNDNLNIGKGLVIGHWGRIVMNTVAEFGNEIMLTHNVTIGRDVRGKRKGSPKIGNRVCIRSNSTVVGNITIGDDVLIAPNTFVNFDVPSHSVVIGNPATIHHRDNATEGHLGIVEGE